MSKATSIYIDADACPVKAGIVVFPAQHLPLIAGASRATLFLSWERCPLQT
jgi:uncharacterized protein YaiI (UPF0178 family)